MCRILILNLILIVSVLQISAIPQFKRLGSKCVVEGKPGNCTFIKDCPKEEYRIVTLGKNARRSCDRFIAGSQLICCEEKIVHIDMNNRMSSQTISIPNIAQNRYGKKKKYQLSGKQPSSNQFTRMTTEWIENRTLSRIIVTPYMENIIGDYQCNFVEIDCYYNGTFPFKCCPAEECHNTIVHGTGNDIPTTGNIIIDKCIEYSHIIEKCINRSNKYCKMAESDGLTRRIVNGKDAIPAEFPHMALLGYGQNKWDNGGTLISERVVLTAAHVLDLGGGYGKVKFVCLGILNRTKACKGNSYKYMVKNITKHPDYKHQMFYNDIALLLLEQSVLLSHRVRPACLPVMRSNITSILTVAGWGVIEENGQQPEILLKTELKEHPASNCKDNYEAYRKLNETWNEDIMFCTSGPMNPDTNRTSDACQGDSGGPVTRQLHEMTCSYEIVGIVSFGYGCGQGGPAGFTRVSNYTEWIVDNVWK